MVGKTKSPTIAEQKRFGKIVDYGCLACRAEKVEQRQATEAHHLLSGGKRRGHRFSIPLCSWHHRGIPQPGWNVATTREIFGPSLRLESRTFHARYGTDDELLAIVNRVIESTEAA